MSRIDIIVLLAAFSFLAFRLYQKYAKKDKQQTNLPGEKRSLLKKPGLEEQADDYEPYSDKDKKI